MIDESWYRRPPGVPEHDAAGGVVVRWQDGRLYVALVGEGDLSGYVLPKGHVEAGEEIEAAARREIEEEAGLRDLQLLAELGVAERLDFHKTAWKRTHYYLYLARSAAGRPTDPRHDYRVSWLPLDDPLPLFWPEQRRLVEEKRALIGELAGRAEGRQ